MAYPDNGHLLVTSGSLEVLLFNILRDDITLENIDHPCPLS